MRALRIAIALTASAVAIGAAALWWFKFDHQLPTATFPSDFDALGRRAVFEVIARAPGTPGLRRVEVLLTAGEKSYPLAAEDLAAVSWIGSRVAEHRLHVDADLRALQVPEGPAQLEVFAETYAWHVLTPRRAAVAARAVSVDVTPPGVELLTTQHNMRLGGSSLALFRVTPDAERVGVGVGDYFFPAVRGYFADRLVAAVFFAVPQDLSAEARPTVHVADKVGNARAVALPCQIRARQFAQRRLPIDDAFLQRKVPEIAAANGLPVTADLVKGYLRINGDLRRESEQQIRAITATPTSAPLWDGPFHRQSNSAPMSAFADRRTYEYHGEAIDQQTHLGYDLASLPRAPVEAAQNGAVAFAGNLGIYGNAVVLDHGFGVFSLYGHLSTIAVRPGQRVRTGESLGQTGDSGLAGGDHLHFSIMLHGIHVDPVEWWDPKWLRDHVTAKLTMFPAADDAAAGARGSEAPPDGQARP